MLPEEIHILIYNIFYINLLLFFFPNKVNKMILSLKKTQIRYFGNSEECHGPGTFRLSPKNQATYNFNILVSLSMFLPKFSDLMVKRIM